MNKKRRLALFISALIFIAFEGLMFYLIHIKDADPDYTLRYNCIIAATVFAFWTLFIQLMTAKKEDESISEVLFNIRNGNFLRIAMLFTLVADYFLVASPIEMELEGVSVFLGTQFFIFLHIWVNESNPRFLKTHLITRILLMAMLVLVAYAVLGKDTDTLAIISVIYYANLLSNLLFAHRSGRGGAILTVGLLLFALCDINVGLSGLNYIYPKGFQEGSLLYELANANIDLIWIFYIPSQTLIPLTPLFCSKK